MCPSIIVGKDYHSCSSVKSIFLQFYNSQHLGAVNSMFFKPVIKIISNLLLV